MVFVSTLSGPDLYSMRVAPGMAPSASLYALKVFGCSGATDAVIPALDWALDPDGDGNYADHLDVVDLSLTGGSGVTDDPETSVLDAVARLGVLPVDGLQSKDAKGPGNVVVSPNRSMTSVASGPACQKEARPSASAISAAAAIIASRVRGPGRDTKVKSGRRPAATSHRSLPSCDIGTRTVASARPRQAQASTPINRTFHGGIIAP